MARTRNHPRKRRPHVRLHLDELEDRTLLTVYTPAQIVTAYGFNQVNFGTSSSPVPGDGRGQTIAIVDAYADPHIASDLATFSRQYGLPQMNSGGPTFTVNDLSNGTPDPTGGNWEVETALDVEWAHAVAPQANILLVEAADDFQGPNGTLTSLMAAVNTAASTPGVVAVSMSWGVPEYPNEVADDAAFSAQAHPGVTFVAASGDSGAGVGFPAISPNVLSVGGTRLSADAAGNYQGETGWGYGRWSWFLGGSGGGRSRYEAQPGYQAGVVPASMSTPQGGQAVRTNPDVAYDADPNTGVVVYNNGNYYAVGGTSVGAPQWAALVAIADQGAALQGSGPLTGATQTLPAIYSAAQSDLHEITSGNNGYAATAGYNLVTGRGSPKAQLIVNDLIQAATSVSLSAGASSSSGGGSSSTTLSSSRLGQSSKKLPTPTSSPTPTSTSGTPARPRDVMSSTAPQTTGLTSSMPVTVTPAAPVGASSTATTTTPLVILTAPAAVTAVPVLPASATVTAVTAAPAAAFTTTVTGLTPRPTFATSAAGNSGGGDGDPTFGPAVGQPGAPAGANPIIPAEDTSTPTPAGTETGAPEVPGAAWGVFGGGVLAGDAAGGGAAAFAWDDGECPTLPNSGAAVAALLMALGYSGMGRTRRPEEDERRRAWLPC